jgi:DNA mismatch endonuclease (patch repair protein)
MQANRRRDTRPEVALRRLLHARGWRFRVDYPPVTGLRRRADIAFTRLRVAVFVDGCYWHACPLHGTEAKSNTEFWANKLAANVARDRSTNDLLVQAGWTVVRVWEHEPPELATTRLEETLRCPQPPRVSSGALIGRSGKNSSDAKLDSSETSQ